MNYEICLAFNQRLGDTFKLVEVADVTGNLLSLIGASVRLRSFFIAIDYLTIGNNQTFFLLEKQKARLSCDCT